MVASLSAIPPGPPGGASFVPPRPVPPVPPVASARTEVTAFHDEASDRLVYRVVDPLSGQVVMQMPSADIIRFFAACRSQGQAAVVAP